MRAALNVTIFTILLTGGVYPLLVTGVSYLFFHKQAHGSLIFNEQHRVVGSELIGQTFHTPAYFFARPSFAGKGYDGMASGGSNDAPSSQQFVERVHKSIEEIKQYSSFPPPFDLVTASASGLDPHITPAAAYGQAPRIALHRNVSLKRIESLIDDYTASPHLYLLGAERVNVLKLNLALDQFFGFCP
jgi:K+-transporting ATPase ATPase C chain